MKAITPHRCSPGALALCAAVLLAACSDDGGVLVTGDSGGGTSVDGSVGTGGDGASTDAGGTGTDGGSLPLPDGPGIGGSTGGGTTNGEDPVVDAADETDLPAGSRAGAYIGTVGGAPAVVVLGLDDAFMGIWPDADTGNSTLISGLEGAEQGLRTVQHASGYAGARAPQVVWPYGGPRADGATTDLSVVDDVSITGTINGQTVSLSATDGELALPTPARLNGSWAAAIPFCDSDDEYCSTVSASIDVSGGSFVGRTAVLTPGGDDLYPSALTGTLTREGDTANVTMIWNTYRYEGVLHFLPGESDRIALLGFTTAPLADHPSIAFILTRS